MKTRYFHISFSYILSAEGEGRSDFAFESTQGFFNRNELIKNIKTQMLKDEEAHVVIDSIFEFRRRQDYERFVGN